MEDGGEAGYHVLLYHLSAFLAQLRPLRPQSLKVSQSRFDWQEHFLLAWILVRRIHKEENNPLHQPLGIQLSNTAV